LFEKIKNDGASYSIYEALRKFASEKPKEAIEVLELIKKEGTFKTLNFTDSILGGLSQSDTNYPYKDEIFSLIKSSNENEINIGVKAAYQVIIKDEQEELKFLNEVNNNLIKVVNNRLFYIQY
jgi:hypothetical protein